MSLDSVRVLLAEDNPTNQLVAAQMLESLGATVTLARDGAEALELAERQSFDAMLIDIEMPRVSGIDVIRRVRQSSAPLAETPIIALTAYALSGDAERSLQVGCDAHLTKPIKRRVMLDAIARYQRTDAPPADALSAAPTDPTSGDGTNLT